MAPRVFLGATQGFARAFPARPGPMPNVRGREELPFANQEALEPPFSGRTKQT